VPYTLDANDMRFATAQGFNSGDQFFAYLRDSFDVLYREGETAPKMMSVGLHCRLVGRRPRGGLARFLDHVAAHERVWVARRIDVARHWSVTTARRPRPERHEPGPVEELFGDVFEHSPGSRGRPTPPASARGRTRPRACTPPCPRFSTPLRGNASWR
jgi:hypothetical protein